MINTEKEIRELKNRIEQLEKENGMSKEAVHLITDNLCKLTEGMDKISVIIKLIVDKIF